MLPKDDLPLMRFIIDPRGMVRKLNRKSTKSPSASANRILFCDLLTVILSFKEHLWSLGLSGEKEGILGLDSLFSKNTSLRGELEVNACFSILNI